MIYTTSNSLATEKLGRKIASGCRGGETFCLSGELGAGKTTFVRGFIHYFLPHTRVLSPTFIIVRHYHLLHETIRALHHIDAYRVSDSSQDRTIGLHELFGAPDSISIIEWADRIESLLPSRRINIMFTMVSENERMILVKNSN